LLLLLWLLLLLLLVCSLRAKEAAALGGLRRETEHVGRSSGWRAIVE
jgi:hypothetical protein